MTTITQLKKGDQIVHQRHGVGEIVGIDTRNISGEPTKYYRMKTNDSLVWLSVDDIESEPIRTVSSSTSLDTSIAILKTKPEEMSDDKNIRAKQIKDITNCNDLELVAAMMRDLSARKQDDLLLYEEKQALKAFIARFSNEWSVSKKISLQAARDALTDVMKKALPAPKTK